MPYLDTLRWVLIAIALIGIAVTIHARLDDWKRGEQITFGNTHFTDDELSGDVKRGHGKLAFGQR